MSLSKHVDKLKFPSILSEICPLFFKHIHVYETHSVWPDSGSI